MFKMGILIYLLMNKNSFFNFLYKINFFATFLIFSSLVVVKGEKEIRNKQKERWFI